MPAYENNTIHSWSDRGFIVRREDKENRKVKIAGWKDDGIVTNNGSSDKKLHPLRLTWVLVTIAIELVQNCE